MAVLRQDAAYNSQLFPPSWRILPSRKRSWLLSQLLRAFPRQEAYPVSCFLQGPAAEQRGPLASTVLFLNDLSTQAVGRSPSLSNAEQPTPGLFTVQQLLEVTRRGKTSYSLWRPGWLFLSDMKLQQSLGGGGSNCLVIKNCICDFFLRRGVHFPHWMRNWNI